MTRPLRPWSLRRRLTLRVLALVVLGWLATILLATSVLHHEMNEVFDEELLSLVETMVLNLDTEPDKGIPRTIGVETSSGERVLRILPTGTAHGSAPWPELVTDGFHTKPGWCILRRTAEGVVIEAAQTTKWRREELLEAAWAFVVIALPLVILLIWGLRRATATATAPVARLAAAVSQRDPDDLSPIETAPLPRELRPLATAFDSYLSRIQSLRRSERDFIANAAHELRTPLATLRGRLQLSADPDAGAAVETVDALTRRVERLLQLSRLESGVGLGRGPTDILRILRMLIDEVQPRARHTILMDDSDLEQLMIAADTDATAILLRNLIENALEHGSGTVRLRLSPAAALVIENPLMAGSLPQGRFQPGEQSPGHGLGLSITGALAQAMGVPMRRSERNGIIRFKLQFTLDRAN